MAEFYMAEHPGSLYSAVAVASPTASNDPADTRILNIGFENDPVYEVTSGDPFGFRIGGADPNNSTTNLFLNLDELGLAGLNTHASPNYIYATERLFDSAYYDQIERDSFVIIDRKDSDVKVGDVFLSTDQNAFILGEDNQADNITGDQKDDVLEGLGGNDTLKGDLISASFFSGDDTLDGGTGNDFLDGDKGEDVAIFSGNLEDYDYSISEDQKTVTFNHIRGTTADGEDTLKNIEFAEFQDTLVETAQLGSISPETVSRIIPLPLEDGIANTVSEQVYVEPPEGFAPDPVTPPYVSLTAPISMLDGDIDYTLNISPYKPDTQYNISYIFDTSGSMDESELQTAKDAYIDLINYYIDTGVADKSNFSVISFSRNANPYFNLTGEQAISIIQNLTTAPTGERTKYNEALYEGLNFLSQSSLNLLNTFYRRFQLNREWFQLASS